MRDTEFNALIHLLEDDDPGVATHIEEALLNMGVSAVPRLETAWSEVKDEVIQQRLEDIIRLLQSNETLEAIAGWKQAGAKDLLYGWYLITRFRFSNIDYTPMRNRINRLVNRAWLELNSDMELAEKCMVLNKLIFKKEGFKPDRRSPLRTENYFIHNFLERKRGGPLSLGLLYLILADSLGIEVEGILLPNHYFVIKAESGDQPFFIDVFNSGAFFSKNDLDKFLQEHNIENSQQAIKQASPEKLILASVNIIMSGLKRKKDEDGLAMYQRLLDAW
ncbi:MAG: transglutaminase family protein [Bacteroidia bacterium]